MQLAEGGLQQSMARSRTKNDNLKSILETKQEHKTLKRDLSSISSCERSKKFTCSSEEDEGLEEFLSESNQHNRRRGCKHRGFINQIQSFDAIVFHYVYKLITLDKDCLFGSQFIINKESQQYIKEDIQHHSKYYAKCKTDCHFVVLSRKSLMRI